MIVLGLSVLIGIAFVVGMLFEFTDLFESDSDDDSGNSNDNTLGVPSADAIAAMAALADAASNTNASALPTTTTTSNSPAVSMNPTTPLLTSAPLAIEPSGGCDDVPPAWWASNPSFKDYTCTQFKNNAEGCALMKGSCRQSCGECGGGSTAVSGNANSDIPPSWAPNTCPEIKSYGGCSEEYMKGFCLKSCGSGNSTVPAASPSTTPVSTHSLAALSGPKTVLAIGDSLTDKTNLLPVLPTGLRNWTDMLREKGDIELQRTAKAGYTAQWFSGEFPGLYNKSFKPMFATILFGTNEANSGNHINGFDTGYKAMMDLVWSNSPDTTFIMMKIPDIVGNPRINTMNTKIQAIYDGYHGAGKHVKLIDLYSNIKSNMYAGDGIHLSSKGDEEVARLVYAAMNSSSV
jgi:lysophospholipase L1-like esterase